MTYVFDMFLNLVFVTLVDVFTCCFTYRHSKKLSRTREKLQDATKGKENCHAVVCDASDPKSVEKAMAQSISLY